MSDDLSAAVSAVSPEFVDSVAAGRVVAGYRLDEQIGQGGMAVVFRAIDQRLGRKVALKVLAPALAGDQAFRQRFIRESRAAAAVDDPHIIPIYGAGEADGVLWIAMRYVPGGDVRTLVQREGPLPAARAAAIVSAVASALDAAHSAGLVHRDVKPANMLLDSPAGRPEHVYLSDFGLSKAWQGTAGLTGSGLFLGTLDYAAPEQIQGLAVDGRTDQYALACAAFEVLAGQPPFQRDQGLAVLYAQLSAPPPSLTGRLPWLAPAVDMVLRRGLAKSPGERYGSCGEFADQLRLALGLGAGEPASPHGQRPRVPTVIVPPGLPAPSGASGGLEGDPGSWSTAATRGPAGAPGQVPVRPPAALSAAPAPPGGKGRAARTGMLAAAAALALLVIGGLSVALFEARHPPSSPPAGSARHRTPASNTATTRSSPPPLPLADFKVCTYAVSGCTGYGRRYMRTEPSRIVTSGDGSGLVDNITWTGWGTPDARGLGVLEIDNCTPSCAAGAYTGYRATVTLTNLVAYGQGKRAYAKIVVSAPGSPYPPGPFTAGLVP